MEDRNIKMLNPFAVECSGCGDIVDDAARCQICGDFYCRRCEENGGTWCHTCGTWTCYKCLEHRYCPICVEEAEQKGK